MHRAAAIFVLSDENAMKIKDIIKPEVALAALLLLLAGCRTAAVSTDRHSDSRDTVYLARHRVDTLHTADTLRLLIKERGDTVWIARDRVRWRERTAVRTDTLWRHRTDTVTRTERVEVEHPRRIRDWAAPLGTGVLAGFVAASLLLRKK